MWKARVFDAVGIAYLFLIALVVVFQPDDMAMLNLGRNTLLAILGVAIGFGFSFGFNGIGLKTLGEAIFEPPHKKALAEPIPWYKTFWGIQLATLFVVTCVAGVQVTQVSLYELTDPDGFRGAKKILMSLFNPEMSILPRGVLAIVETIFIAFMATVIAVPIAFVLSFLCAKNIMGGTPFGFGVYMFLRTVLNVTRSIEPLIWAIIFTVWVGIGPFAGMLGLMLHSIASLAKQYSEFIECVEDGPIEGITATGAGPLQVVWFAVVPQIVLPYISFTIYRWDINVRMATIIGLVGGGGIGTMLIQYQGQAMWPEVGTLALLIVIAVWAMDTASAYIREAIK